MRIRYISHSSAWGGAETSLYHLVTTLDAAQYQPFVLIPEDGSLAEKLRNAGIQVDCSPMPPWRQVRNWYRRKRALTRLKRLIQPPSLIHCNTVWSAPYAHAIAHHTGVPLIIHVRDLLNADQVRKYRLAEAQAVVAISEAVAAPLLQTGIDRCEVIPNGVDLGAFHMGGPNVLGHETRVRIGILGQIVPGCRWKGYDTFLEAATRLRDEAAHFFIIGGDTRPATIPNHGGYLRELRELAASLGVETCLTFTGFRDDIPEVMASLDVVVNASWAEPFGRTIIEAMAAGKPVIGTQAGGAPEIIVPGETGLLVPPRDAAALADAMRHLIQARDTRLEMGEKGRRRVEKHFSLQAHVRQIQRLYDRMAV